MSKEIKITVVIKNDKNSNPQGKYESTAEASEKVIMTHDSAATVMSTLLKNGLISGSFCGGRGTCGRCQIQYLGAAPLPTPLERSVMEPQQLRQGYRLACMSRPKDNCVIRLAMPEERKVDILTQVMGVSGQNDLKGQSFQTLSQASLSHQKKENCMIAVDLGTTTIAMQLRGMESGEVLDTYCEMNPQRSYGADVLSRIQAACTGAGKILQDAVWEVLRKGVRQFQRNYITHDIYETGAISCMCIAGNTTMIHLLMGYDVSGLGQSPFTPVTLDLLEETWENRFPVYVAPGISTFVGGDIVAGLYALSMLPGQKRAGSAATEQSADEQMTEEQTAAEQTVEEQTAAEDRQASGKIRMLLDLGTNGEMAITDGNRMIVTATAAGPAFEGGAGAQVIGTDMIALTAELLRNHMIEETGYMEVSPCTIRGITMTQQDIRAIQLAKAAVRAGTEILWLLFGEKQPETDREALARLEQVYLAGGFGYYLDVEAAFSIGLLPKRMRGKVQAVGNTALEGAYRLGRDFHRKLLSREDIGKMLSQIEPVNLAKQESFEKRYLMYMNF